MKLILPLVILTSLVITEAQAQYKRSIRVKAGDDIPQSYSPQGFYRYPQFTKATIYFRDGGQNSNQQLNYNFLSNTMQFISPKGDTLDIGGEANIDSVKIGDNLFVSYNGFMEVVRSEGSLLLLKKLVIKTQVEDIGAYGIPTQTGSIDNIKSHSFGSNVYSFRANQDVVISENIFWFFADRNRNVLKASKSNLMKLLPANLQTKADASIKKNKPSFDKEDDLKKLVADISI